MQVLLTYCGGGWVRQCDVSISGCETGWACICLSSAKQEKQAELAYMETEQLGGWQLRSGEKLEQSVLDGKQIPLDWVEWENVGRIALAETIGCDEIRFDCSSGKRRLASGPEWKEWFCVVGVAGTVWSMANTEEFEGA